MGCVEAFWAFVKQNHAAFVAVLALIVSCVAIYQTSASLRMQREHNYRSLRPLPVINRLKYVNRVGVEIENRGLGPMLIRTLKVFRSSNPTDIKTNFIDWMPPLDGGSHWATFKRGLQGTVLQAEKRLSLLELTGEPSDPVYAQNRDRISEALAPLVVEIDYTDIYDRPFVLRETFTVFQPRNESREAEPAT